MKPWTVIAGWAALLALWTAVQLAFSPPWLTLVLLGGAAAAVLVLAAAVTRERRPRRSPELSFATPLLALGVAALVSGAELGTWCLLLGALITACGLATLAAEGRR